MRKIKFRARDTKSNCWRYWTVLEDCMCDLVVYDSIDKDTLGQWIGQKDNTGKDIYEGDNVQEIDLVGTVHYNPEMARFQYTTSTANVGMYHFNGKIIGNIHESGG